MLLAEEPAQLRDRDAQARLRRRRRALAPQLVGQPVARHGLVRVDEQEREERALPCPDERSLGAVDPDLERAEHAKRRAGWLPSPVEFRPPLRGVTERLQPGGTIPGDEDTRLRDRDPVPGRPGIERRSGSAPGREGDPGRQAPRGRRRAAGALWVTNDVDNSVSRVDPATNAVTATVRLRGRDFPDPSIAVAGGGSLWVAARTTGTISRIDPVTGTLVATFAAPKVVDDILVADGSLWVASFDPYRCRRTTASRGSPASARARTR